MEKNYPKFSDKTLIMGTFCHGSCDALALDILIYSLKFKRVGYLDLNYIRPIVLNLEEITGGITLPCELYEKDNLVILQFRSSIVQGCGKQVRTQIDDFISNNTFNQVICLSSIEAANVIKDYFTHPEYDFEFFPNFIRANLFKSLNSLPSPLTEKVKAIKTLNDHFKEHTDDVEKEAVTGIAPKLNKAKAYSKVPFLTLYGLSRNIFDIESGLFLAEVITKLLDIKVEGKLKTPTYFENLFG